MEGILSVIVAMLSLTALSVFFAVYFKKKFLETVFVSIGFTILVLFLFGLLNFRGDLLVGYWLIICSSVIATIFSVRTIYKKPDTMYEIDLWRGIAVMGIFLLVSLYLNYNRLFISWDEFSHWGIVVKHMYSLDALGSITGSTLLFPDYFPGISLFQYFFTRANPNFVEYPVFIASNILFFSMVFVFIKKIDLKTVLSTLAFLAIPLIIGTSSYMAFYSNILVDVLIGCLFGFSVVAYFYYTYNEDSQFAIVMSAVSLSILAVSKDIGIIFALFAIAVCALDTLLYRRKETARYLNLKNKRLKIKHLAVLLLPVVMPIIFWLLYKIHLKIVGVASSWPGVNTVGLFSNNLEKYQIDTIHTFWDKFFNTPYVPLPTSLFWSMAVLFAILCLWSVFIKDRNLARRVCIAGSMMSAGLFVYAGLILILYLLVFSEYEAIRLSSWERYMATYLAGFAVFVLGAFFYKARFLQSFFKSHKNTIVIAFFFGAVAIGYAAASTSDEGQVFSSIAHAREEVGAIQSTREQYQAIKGWKSCLNNPNDRLNIIATNTKGNERNILKYTLYPAMAQTYYRNDYSVGENPYDAGDMWTMISMPQDWGRYVTKNYTLVYVFKYDELFKASYGYYFDRLTDNQLYRVSGSGDSMKLISVEPNCGAVGL